MYTSLDEIISELEYKIIAKQDLIARLERLKDTKALNREKYFLGRMEHQLESYKKERQFRQMPANGE